MNASAPIVTVFGGTGFLGRSIVAGFAALGCTVRVATRLAQNAGACRVVRGVGQIVPFEVNYSDEASLRRALQGADFAVYSIGLLFERGKNKFETAHISQPATIARLCREENVPRFVHISAMACDKGTSRYARTKRAGEEAILSANPSATILRPSLIFGPGDGFFNMFGEMMRFFPALPLIGGGHTKFQPVYVEDVAAAAVRAATNADAAGKIYDLAGPQVFTMKELLERLKYETKRNTFLVSLPFALATVDAHILNLLPKPPLTPDQVESLKTDNLPDPSHPGLAALGIEATSVDGILPTYLNRFIAGGERNAVA